MIYVQLERPDEAKLRAVLLPYLPHIHEDSARNLFKAEGIVLKHGILNSPQKNPCLKKNEKMGIDMPKTIMEKKSDDRLIIRLLIWIVHE